MSTKAKLTLAGTSLGALGIIVFVHYAQKSEKAVWQTFRNIPSKYTKNITNTIQAMHEGVLADIERQRIKKERQLDFEMQAALEAEYRKIQNVSDGRSKS